MPEFLRGQYPAAFGLLGGGRNSLQESAQEATLMSVPTWLPSVNRTAACDGSVFRVFIGGFLDDNYTFKCC